MPTTRAMARAKQVAHKAGGGTRLDFGAKDDEVLDGTGTGYTQPIGVAQEQVAWRPAVPWH